MAKSIHAILLAVMITTAYCLSQASPARKRTLVLIDNASFYLTHSEFFRMLSEMGHTTKVEQITVKMITDGAIKLEEDKELLYDNIIFMATSLAELPETSEFNLARFFDKGGNIFFMIDTDVSPFFREYFKKFGFGIDQTGSYLVDYDRALDQARPNIFQVNNFKDISMLAENVNGPLVYNGLGLETTIFENHQIHVFARGSINTASVVYGTSGKKYLETMGKNNILMLGIQGLEKGRVITSGSLDMFSNNLFALSKGENKKYARNLIEWISYERGVARIASYSYSCIDDKGNDSECPKKSRFRFSADMEYWNWSSKRWLPYSDDNISLELTLMTPKYRQTLPESTTKKGHYALFGNIPNRMGTYRFKINHNRPGWSRLWLYKKILVRNKNNKEMVKNWPRDMVAATGVVVVLISFAYISYFFVYDDRRTQLVN